jgi:hypothetical protein
MFVVDPHTNGPAAGEAPQLIRTQSADFCPKVRSKSPHMSTLQTEGPFPNPHTVPAQNILPYLPAHRAIGRATESSSPKHQVGVEVGFSNI